MPLQAGAGGAGGGPTVLVVRPRAQARDWVDQLTAAGVAALALPLIEILPAPQPGPVAQVFSEVRRLAGDDDVARPLLVFVSPNAVLGFFAAVAADAADRGAPAAPWPAQAWAAATGPGTVAALRAAGVPPERIAAPPPASPQFDSEALWQCIQDWHWQARPVWIVRGNGGRDLLAQRMQSAGADVAVVQSYGRAAPSLTTDERATLAAALARPSDWVWLFSSSEAIGHLESVAPGVDWRAGRALASHPRIGDRARGLGFENVTVIAPSPVAVVQALRRMA